MASIRLWTLSLSCAIAATLVQPARAKSNTTKSFTDTCQVGNSNKLIPFEVLPGVGWDNLRNIEGANLVHHNFSLCQTTGNGAYLIPNHVLTIPIKRSERVTYAQMFSNWQDYTSATATSININAGLGIKQFGLGGMFSRETLNIRSRQYFDHSVASRAELRYNRYRVKLQPGYSLNEDFKSNLLTIARYIHLNKLDMARYASQLLVRDFGTHVLTSVDAGAMLAQTEEVKTTFVNAYSSKHSTLMAAMSLHFIAKFSLGIKSAVELNTVKRMMEQYIGNITHSEVRTYGGSLFRTNNFSVNDWISGIDRNLVAIDRSGDPIHYLITENNFPDLPLLTVYRLRNTVKEAIQAYYKYNTYYGCTKADSPNFSFHANVDDGSCESPTNNYTFGGAYQTCKSKNKRVSIKYCPKLEQKNVLTGGFTCPSEYEAVPLDHGIKKYPELKRKCKRCYLISTCCKDVVEVGEIEFSAFWCAAKKDVPSGSGYLFGGVYTPTIKNLLTKASVCPMYFYPLRLSERLHVCVSRDYEFGYKHSVPFAGFFSCKEGNPLKYLLKPKQGHKSSTVKGQQIQVYETKFGKSNYQAGCPNGYSAHLGDISNGCEINYCIQVHALSGRTIPTIKRPPFIEIPPSGFADNDTFILIEDAMKIKEIDESDKKQVPERTTDKESAISTGGVVVISVTATLLLISTLGVVVLIRRFKRMKPQYQRMESSNILPNKHVNYGCADTELDMIPT